MEVKKILEATWGPIKTVTIVWLFLITIFGFINSIFFDEKGFLNFLYLDYRAVFGIVSVIISGILFLFWLLVWNILINAFFKEDIKVWKKNNSELAKLNG